MTDTRPGADEAELALAATLRARGVGPDAAPLPALPPADDLPPGYRPSAWSWSAYFASDVLSLE
ncbi:MULTISPECIES: hypothetical protein [unclassified Streptomyces]|uniref:hypothetical protein n=1 Tax=unclassified Streptomyces TaxID=2593676 RepID=UPI003BB6BF92